MIRVVLRVVLTGMFMAVALAGCGKKGSPSPPGPAQDVTYPKAYPNPLLP